MLIVRLQEREAAVKLFKGKEGQKLREQLVRKSQPAPNEEEALRVQTTQVRSSDDRETIKVSVGENYCKIYFRWLCFEFPTTVNESVAEFVKFIKLLLFPDLTDRLVCVSRRPSRTPSR